MKHAVTHVMDQSIGYVTEDGSLTVRPSEAALFDSEEEAGEAADDGEMLQAVPNEAAFRAKAPEWGDRPVTKRSLFDIAVLVSDVARNEHLTDALRREHEDGLHTETCLLWSAAENLLKQLGHRGADGRWVFGPKPSAA